MSEGYNNPWLALSLDPAAAPAPTPEPKRKHAKKPEGEARHRKPMLQHSKTHKVGDKVHQFKLLKYLPGSVAGGKRVYALWLCRCSCGREVLVRPANLTSGNSKSCGHDRTVRDPAKMRRNAYDET